MTRLRFYGAPPHLSRQVTSLMTRVLDRWISGSSSSVACPSRSPALIPLGCYLWDRMTSLVYEEEVNTRWQNFERCRTNKKHSLQPFDNEPL